MSPAATMAEKNGQILSKSAAAACRILEQVTIGRNDRVLVLGDGRLGNLCAQVLATTRCQLTVVGKHSWKLKHLADLHIDSVLLKDLAPSSSHDFVIDCTGSPDGLDLALKSVKPCGTVIQKTTVAAPQTLHMAPVVIDEIQLIGSRCGPFAPALEMLTTGKVRVDEMISGEYSLEEAAVAFEHAIQPDALKVLFNVAA